MSATQPASPPLAGGTEGGRVPRLDLAPKLKRPLQLWNPLDYVRLLYWCFFFPQALRWYVEIFSDPKYRCAAGRDLLPALRQDRVQRDLAFQGLLLVALIPLAASVALRILNEHVNWLHIVFVIASIVFGLEIGALRGVARGIASGVPGGVAVSVVSSVVSSVIFSVSTRAGPGFVAGVTFAELSFVVRVVSIAVGMALGVALSAVFGAGGGMTSRMTSGAASSAAVGAARGMVVGMVLGMVLGVALSVAFGAAFGVALGVAFGVAIMVTTPRLPDYVVSALLSTWFWPRGGTGRVTPLPLPGAQRRLEDWLAWDWTAGVYNANQLLAYTMQFIPVVQAVNVALARLPEERLLAAVDELANRPFDWSLLCFGSASLRNVLWRAAIGGIFIVPGRTRRRWQARFPVEPRLGTSARAACAGFWYLHEQQPAEATEAFAVVRALPGGEELCLIASALAAALEAQDPVAVGRWMEHRCSGGASLPELPEPYLRPAAVATLRRLREVAQEADVAVHAVSPLMRSSAIGRAVAALTQLLADADETCPEPERAIVKQVAEQWRDVLARAGGQIGAQVLRQPVENPYEGYSGLPVERTFAGRETTLAQLEKLWAASPDAPLPPIILYGHRRMGKTSIIHHLYRHRGPETLIARTDMQDLVMADHTGQLLLGFARAIHAAAREAGLAAGPAPGADDYASTGAARLALNALLERLDPQMAGRRLTLAIDEYEIAEEKLERGEFDPAFLRYLRSAAQRHRWLGLLFAGRQALEDELRHYKAVFYGSAEPVRVSFLAREAALHLIRQPADDFALEYELALAEELYCLTHGQPYLLQRLCWELVNHWNDRFLKEGEETSRTLTPADLEALLTPDFYHELFLQADYYFSGVWSEAGPDEHRLLKILASREDDAPLSRTELVQEAGLGPERAEEAIKDALRHDLIVEKDDVLRLAVPLMRPWIRTLAETSEV
jgi:hypothetical protein